MSLLSTFDRVTSHQPEAFIAPVFDAKETVLFTVQDDIPYHFKVRSIDPGWYEFTPRTTSWLDDSRNLELQPGQYLEYLNRLPRFYVIALYALSDHSWLVLPFNSSDAAQRGWKNCEPRILHLTRRYTLQPFDLIEARSLAGTLIFHYVNMKVDSYRSSAYALRGMIGRDTIQVVPQMTSEWLIAFNLVAERYKKIMEEQRREQQLKFLEEMHKDTETRLRYQLEFMGAELLNWHEEGAAHRVTWRHKGHEYTMDVSKDMSIYSAGVCLAGYDHMQNLSSVVDTMVRWREDDLSRYRGYN